MRIPQKEQVWHHFRCSHPKGHLMIATEETRRKLLDAPLFPPGHRSEWEGSFVFDSLQITKFTDKMLSHLAWIEAWLEGRTKEYRDQVELRGTLDVLLLRLLRDYHEDRGYALFIEHAWRHIVAELVRQLDLEASEIDVEKTLSPWRRDFLAAWNSLRELLQKEDLLLPRSGPGPTQVSS
jgi:hypothetical protein